MMYLHPEEWLEVLRNIPRLKAQLRSCQEHVEELDETGAKMEAYNLRRQHLLPDKYDTRRIGNGPNPGRRPVGRFIKTGPIPPKVLERRTRLSTTEFARYNKGEMD